MPVLVSVVSHQQINLVFQLLKDIEGHSLHEDLEVIVTVNVQEKIPFKPGDFGFKLRVIQNEHPQGFGANHNAVFRKFNSHFFCILNPDIRLTRDPFPLLSAKLVDHQAGVIAPIIVNEESMIEDSARRLPTPFRLARRYWLDGKKSKTDYPLGNKILSPDWVAGIFMLFQSRAFSQMNGFDERYRLYFEDVDICHRLRLAGYKILLDPMVSVVHNARRDSHRNMKYLWWHFQSAVRFFSSRVFWSSWFSQFNLKIKKIS
jgi:N-acetylglucosaminyl-diphospho-decaprenol L-rhamnosyltransferase